MLLWKRSEAEEWLRKSLSIWPGQSSPHFDLGRVYGQQHRLAEARAEFRACLRYAPPSRRLASPGPPSPGSTRRSASTHRRTRPSLTPSRNSLCLAVPAKVSCHLSETTADYNRVLSGQQHVDAYLGLPRGNAPAGSGVRQGRRRRYQSNHSTRRQHGFGGRPARSPAATAPSGWTR